jgi:hypothetical protein
MNSQIATIIKKKINSLIKEFGAYEAIIDVAWHDLREIRSHLFLARNALRVGDLASVDEHIRNAVDAERVISVQRKKFFKPEIALCCKLYAYVHPTIEEDGKPRII